jgi:hypothetical protein
MRRIERLSSGGENDLSIHEQVAVQTSEAAPAEAEAEPAPAPSSATAHAQGFARMAQAPRQSSMIAELDAIAQTDANAPQKTLASDAHSGPLLVYEAELGLAVYKVDETERKAIEIGQALGGYLVSQDERRLVLRVPAAKFQDALKQLEGVGDVRGRRIHSEDVTADFRDLNIRLRNAEEVRDRLAALLAKANDAAAALAIEKELDRVTEQLERLKGELRAMEERIAFSKITLLFEVKRWETLDPDFRLPFDWLQSVGLQQLLSL